MSRAAWHVYEPPSLASAEGAWPVDLDGPSSHPFMVMWLYDKHVQASAVSIAGVFFLSFPPFLFHLQPKASG